MKRAAPGEKVAVRAGSDCSQRTQTTIFVKEEVVTTGTPGIHPHRHSFSSFPDIFSPLPLSPFSYYILKIHEGRVFIVYAHYCASPVLEQCLCLLVTQWIYEECWCRWQMKAPSSLLSLPTVSRLRLSRSIPLGQSHLYRFCIPQGECSTTNCFLQHVLLYALPWHAWSFRILSPAHIPPIIF